MLRVIQEANPEYVIGENVANIENINDGMVVEQIQSDLENIGYEVCPAFEIPACAVGANHIRNRQWFLAHANSVRFTQPPWDSAEQHFDFLGENTWSGKLKERGFTKNRHNRTEYNFKSILCGNNDGIPNRVDRLKGLGNAIVPQVVVPIMQAIKDLEEQI